MWLGVLTEGLYMASGIFLYKDENEYTEFS